MIIKISKFLSLILRHKPEKIGLQLDGQGWAVVEELLQKMNEKGMKISQKDLEYVVENNNKKRFAFNADKSKIRASQGHSIPIDLGYKAQMPPAQLYHGTAEKFVSSILKNGIQKRNRQHVHLSADVETAINVGKRHGKPKVLQINAALMQENGFEFFISENGVWLTDFVPSEYLAS